MRWCLLGLLWLAACASPAVDDDGRFELFVLGVAQDGGVPHLGCDKVCCVEARASGRRRFPVSLGVHDRETGSLLLIEASPAIEAQVALLQELSGSSGRGRRPVDAVMITHAHIGHYLGLAQLGREVAGVRGLPVFVTPRFGEYLRGHGPWRQLVDLEQIELRESEPGQVFEPLPGLRVRSVAVPHRDEFSDTVAFRIEGPNRTVLFVPDIDRWERAGTAMDDLFDGVDVAYVDGTFYDGSELPGRNLSEIPHPLMLDSMERLASRTRHGSVRFIHLNHTNPALRDRSVVDEVRRRGFALAERGERVSL